jgi:hypothetical protein
LARRTAATGSGVDATATSRCSASTL